MRILVIAGNYLTGELLILNLVSSLGFFSYEFCLETILLVDGSNPSFLSIYGWFEFFFKTHFEGY